MLRALIRSLSIEAQLGYRVDRDLDRREVFCDLCRRLEPDKLPMIGISYYKCMTLVL